MTYITNSDTSLAFINVERVWYEENITFTQYQKEIQKTKSLYEALAMAYFFKDNKSVQWYRPQEKPEKIKFWLKNAKTYMETSSKESFEKLVNIEDFIENNKTNVIDSNTLDIIDIFGGENVEKSLAQYKVICLEKTYDQRQVYERVGRLLQKTTLIEVFSTNQSDITVFVGCAYQNDDANIRPIVNALCFNSSLTELNFANSIVCEEAVSEVIDAIQNNPTTRITKLDLSSCQMTDMSATKLWKLISIKTQIVSLNIAYNRDISKSILKEIKTVLDCNIKSFVKGFSEFMLDLKIEKNLINIVLDYLSLPKFEAKSKTEENSESMHSSGLTINMSSLPNLNVVRTCAIKKGSKGT